MFRPPMMPLPAPLPPAMPLPPYYGPSPLPQPMYHYSPHTPMHPHPHPHLHLHPHPHHPVRQGVFHPPIAKSPFHRQSTDGGDSPVPEAKKQAATRRPSEGPSPRARAVTPSRPPEDPRRLQVDTPPTRPTHAPAAPRDTSPVPGPAAVRPAPSTVNIDDSQPKTKQPRQRVSSGGKVLPQRPSPPKSKEADKAMPTRGHPVPLRPVFHRPRNQAVEEIYEEFMTEATCVVCMDLMVAPHQICPCGHVLCGPCGVSWFEGRASEGHELTCPSCRKAVSKENMFVPVKVLENLIAKWVEGRQRNGGWEGYQDWKERNEAWTLHKQFNPEAISSNMFEANPQDVLRRVLGGGEGTLMGEGIPMETLLNLIAEHAGPQGPQRHGRPSTHTIQQQTPMGLMEMRVSGAGHGVNPSPFMSMMEDFDRMFADMDGLGGAPTGHRHRR